MPDTVAQYKEELDRLGRQTLQIPAQEDTLADILSRLAEVQRTKIVSLTNVTVNAGDTHNFLTISATKGFILETLILSEGENFSVILEIDGSEALNTSYANLNRIGQEVKSIDAFAQLDINGSPTDRYLVHIKELNFKTSIKISVKNTSASPLIFRNLFVNYLEIT